jgi:hypothetical protein
VRIIPTPASMGDLGIQPISHPYSEIFLAGMHMTMTLATKRPTRLRIQTSSEQQHTLHTDPPSGVEDQASKICELGEDRCNSVGVIWEQPRVLVTHNAANTEHTIYVHWDHPDAQVASDGDSGNDGGRLLQVYAADLVTADDVTGLQQGWPQVLEYSVWVAAHKHGSVADTGGTILSGLASSLGGWLSGSLDSGPPAFVPLKRGNSGNPISVDRHLQNLPTNISNSVESLVSRKSLRWMNISCLAAPVEFIR